MSYPGTENRGFVANLRKPRREEASPPDVPGDCERRRRPREAVFGRRLRSRAVTSRKSTLDSGTVSKIDRITQMLLVQLEAQTQAALALLERASPEQRDAFLAQVAELRGRLARLRRNLVGSTAPTLVRSRPSG
jgi:hypothetical protein